MCFRYVHTIKSRFAALIRKFFRNTSPTDKEVKLTPEQIIEALQVNSGLQSNVYQLGCVARRATIHSQQQRALNLAWALKETGALDSKPSICIVGAGFSGLMVAASLKALGHDPCVYEKMRDELHLQRGNTTRFIEPNIYDWQDGGKSPRFPLALFPFFRWFHGSAGSVVEQVLVQWRRIGIVPVFGKKVTAIEPNHGQYLIKFENGPDAHADIVILSVGYGLERTVAGHIRLSYWRNDGLAQPLIGYGDKAKSLVSGVGDGGLLDVFRLSLKDFEHKQFMYRLLNREDFCNLATQAKAVFAHRQDGKAWEDIVFPKELLDWVDDQKRADTDVFLNYGEPLFGNTSALLHRMVLAILLKLEIVHPIEGRLVRTFTTEEAEYAIIQPPTGNNSIAVPVAQIVVRHGTDSELEKLVTKDDLQVLRAKVPTDQTFKSQHSEHFLLDAFMPFRLELRYRVHFMRFDANRDQKVNDVITELSTQLGIAATKTMPLLERSKTAETWDWNGRTATVSISDAPLVIQGGSVHCVTFVLETDSRSLLETALQGYLHFYQKLEFDVTPDEHEPPWESLKLEGSRIYFEQLRPDGTVGCRILVVSSSEPWNDVCNMKQAHRLLTPDIIMHVLRHDWSEKAMIDLGWRLTASADKDFSWIGTI